MIFVTVGTHEQQFDRLIKFVDELKGSNVIEDEVVMQIGYSTFEPKYCTWSKLFPYSDMLKNVADARIVITHGGPSSFIMPLQIGKIPIVVPRQKQFKEHVNNHQIEFVKQVSERMGTIIPVLNINELEETILNYSAIVSSLKNGINSNNANFNQELENIVEKMF